MITNICVVRDGSAENNEECRCGSLVCTASTGLICFAVSGGGSCRKNNVGAYGYHKQSSGVCKSVSGRASILDRASCEAAARSM